MNPYTEEERQKATAFLLSGGVAESFEKAVASINEIDYGDERNVYRYEVDGDGTLIASAARGKEIRIPNDHHE